MPDRSKFNSILLIIFVFVILRLLFLFFTPYSFYCEEAKEGSIGHDLVFEKGLRLPFWGYLDSPHAGGSLLAGISAIPFYVIFGDRYLALKITALFYSICAILLWYHLLAFEIKNRKKLFFLFLIFFSFASPHYLQKSLVLIGNTVELMFFNVLIIFYFWIHRYNIFFNRNKCFLLGVICGFSFWVQFMNFYLFITIILFLLLNGQLKELKRPLIYILIGFLFGALPLWIYNISYNWATFTANARQLSFLPTLNKFWQLILVDIPASFHFLDIGNVKAQFFGYSLYALFWATILIHLFRYWINRSKNNKLNSGLEIFLILYLGVFIFITSFTNAPVGSSKIPGWNSMNVHAEYYIVSLQPVIFALFILLLKHRVSIVRFINITAMGIIFLGYCILFQQPYFNYKILEPMHSTESNAYECGFNFFHNPKLFFSFEKNISSELKVYYFKGAGMAANYLLPAQADRVASMFNKLFMANIEPELWDNLLRGTMVGEKQRNELLLEENYKWLSSILPSKINDILIRVYQQEINIFKIEYKKLQGYKVIQ